MPKTITQLFIFAGAFAVIATASASAQTAPAAPVGSGLLGQDYVGLYEGYIRHDEGAPLVDHDYGFTYNQSIVAGLDANADYSYLTGSGRGHDWEQQALFGATAYAPVNWGKPFVGAELGWAWSDFADHTENGFTYRFTGGVEFQTLPSLAIAPFTQYQQIHAFNEPGWPAHDWNFGVKATYRLSQHWSATLTPQIDQYRNLDYQLGLNFHF